MLHGLLSEQINTCTAGQFKTKNVSQAILLANHLVETHRPLFIRVMCYTENNFPKFLNRNEQMFFQKIDL